jgi:8-oxo-dGTP pyrophosphatase MutT (NUDIX family)
MIYLDKPLNFNLDHEVVSCYVIYNQDILLLLRQDHKWEGNKWAPPAGKIEIGEDIFLAGLRELEEETQLKPSWLEHLTSVYVKLHVDILYHMTFANYIYRPEIVLNLDQHKDYTWVTPESALEMNLVVDEADCIRLVKEKLF